MFVAIVKYFTWDSLIQVDFPVDSRVDTVEFLAGETQASARGAICNRVSNEQVMANYSVGFVFASGWFVVMFLDLGCVFMLEISEKLVKD